ncbi:MAG: hemolysin III family protein [Oscillospiraceae bacterium]
MAETVNIKKSNLTKEERQKRWYEGRIHLDLPKYSVGEEIFSAVTHGLSALFAIAALVILLVVCRKEAVVVASVSIFGGAMILLYTISTLYHALGINRAKGVFRILDHCVIFLLIAGTYTPITLVCLGGTQGWILFFVVWCAAAIGIVLNAVNMKRFAKLSMVCYLAMGWVIVFVMQTFIENAGMTALVFLGVGGLFYTLGAVLYLFGKKIPYMHSIWHLFVFGGSFFHFLTVYQLVAM